MNADQKEAFVRALSKECVCDDPETLAEFSRDRTENPSGKPDLVVYARTPQDVQRLLAEANRHKVPVIPVVGNSNISGLAIPQQGGIILNLTRMNRILEVNEEDQFAVIEPGVTWQDIHDHLAANHPKMRFAYSLSPPDTSVMANFLMDGLVNLSLRHGSAAHWINALEVVLPNGDLLRTGHWAFGSMPCTNSPFPGLEGLFTGFQGSTGVAVKMSVQIWPERKFRRRLFLPAYNIDHAFGLIRSLSREDLIDDLGGLSLSTAKMLFGEPRPTFRDPAEPLLFVYIDVSSNFEKDFQSKLDIVNEFVGRFRDAGARFETPLNVQELVGIEPAFAKFATFPTRLDFLLDHPSGGLTWIGTYGPTSRWAEGVKKGFDIMARHHFPPLLVTRPMRGGHFGVLRFLCVFDRDNPEETEKVRAMNRDLADMCVDLGFFPYKTPQWVWERYARRIDPTMRRLVRDIRRMLDPNGILNPGHLDIPLDPIQPE